MPSKTEKQARFMAACAHGAGYESCPPDEVSKEFNQADKGTGILKKRQSFKEYVNEATLVSNKDGRTTTRQSSYASSEPNSYHIHDNNGEKIGSVNQMKDPKYNFKTTHWFVTWHKKEHWNRPNSFQYISQLKSFVKQLNEELIESTVHTIDFKNEHGQVIKKRIKVPNTWTKDDIKKHYGIHLIKIYD